MEQAAFTGPNTEHDSKYGLSRFRLTTFVDERDQQGNVSTKTISLVGLLDELPELSFSVDYADGPGSIYQDLLSDFMTNDLFALVNVLGANGTTGHWQNMVKAGAFTKKVYNGYKPGTITLKFKIYAADTLGQTSGGVWVNMLSKYATIAGESKFSLKKAMENIGNGLGNAYSQGQTWGEIMRVNYTSKAEADRAEATENSAECERKRQLTNSLLPRLYAKSRGSNMNAVIKFNKVLKIDDPNATPNIISSDKHTGIVWYISRGTKSKIYIGANYNLVGAADSGSVPDVKELYSNTFGDYYSTDSPSSVIGPEEIQNAFNEAAGKATDPGVKKLLSNLSDEITIIANNIRGGEQMGNDIDDLYLGSFGVRKTLNELGNSMVGKYGPYRVSSKFNRSNSFGAKLWYLNLYDDVIFKKETPLIVYISDWSVQNSEESNPEEPLYQEFSITCCLDQVYSRAQWYRVLADGVTAGMKESSWVRPDLPLTQGNT